MKGRLIVFFWSLCFFSTACSKLELPPDTPACIQDEISANYKNENWATGSVKEYQFQNKIVYAFAPDETIIADASTPVKDADCNLVCNVGGFGGPSINLCNGEDFFQTAILKRTIWSKR